MGRTWIWGLLLIAAPSLASARGVSTDPIPRFVKPVFEEIVVRWQAQAWQAGGQLRLYRGADTASLRLIHFEAVRPGLEAYQVRDVDSGAAEMLYELRYAETSGRERSLGRIRCVRVQEVRELPPADPGGSGALLLGCLGAAAPLGGWVELGEVPAPVPPHPHPGFLSPAVPPPKASAVA